MDVLLEVREKLLGIGEKGVLGELLRVRLRILGSKA